MASAGRARRVLIVVQNLPVPFDRRVWLEATTLARAGYRVSVICPKAKGFTRSFEVLEDVHIYRYGLPVDAQGALGFVAEFLWCFVRTAMKSVRVAVAGRGFDVLHVCNPPETYWPLGRFWKRLGKRFLFDHHDLSPEMFQVKFGSGAGRPWPGCAGWSARPSRRPTWSSPPTRATSGSRSSAAGRRRATSTWSAPARPGAPHRLPARPGLAQRPPPPDRLPRRDLQAGRGRPPDPGGQAAAGRPRARRRPLRARRRRAPPAEHQGLRGGDRRRRPVHLHRPGERRRPLPHPVLGRPRGRPRPQERLVGQEHDEQDHGVPVLRPPGGGLRPDREPRLGRPGGDLRHPNREADLASRILELLDDPARRQKMGRVGQERVRSVLAWEHSAPVLLAAYDRLWPDSGPRVIELERQPAAEERRPSRPARRQALFDGLAGDLIALTPVLRQLPRLAVPLQSKRPAVRVDLLQVGLRVDTVQTASAEHGVVPRRRFGGDRMRPGPRHASSQPGGPRHVRAPPGPRRHTASPRRALAPDNLTAVGLVLALIAALTLSANAISLHPEPAPAPALLGAGASAISGTAASRRPPGDWRRRSDGSSTSATASSPGERTSASCRPPTWPRAAPR